jgi:hypothetical protein
MRVCIFGVRCTLLAGISIVYLNFGKIKSEYTMRVCIWILKKNSDEQTAHRYFFLLIGLKIILHNRQVDLELGCTFLRSLQHSFGV